MRRLFAWMAAVGSGVLLRAAFAPYNESEAAWFALIPLIVAARFVSPRQAFRMGLVSGLVFWFLSLAWLWRLVDNGGPWPLVVFGHFALSLYCAAYTGVFAALVAGLWNGEPVGSHVADRPEPVPPAEREEATRRELGNGDARTGTTGLIGVWGDLGRALLAALAWAGLEFIRSTFLTGFAWNHLGVSQVSNRAILQAASAGGVYAVSALVLLLNAVVASVVIRVWCSARGRQGPRRHWDLMVALAVVVVVFLWGGRRIRRVECLQRSGPTLMVAAVQPDAPSIFERDDAESMAFVQRLVDRTESVAAFRPDVIVWPETVLLGAVPRDPETMAFAFGVARRSQAPLLAGAVEVEDLPDGSRVIANASWMFRPEGGALDHYRKQHLVPFGEFIPLDQWFPALERLSPIGYSCTAGTNSTTMRVAMRGGLAGLSKRGGDAEALPPPEAVLSPLICFEDTVARLARNAVRAGATVLVNQSNDAWFAGSSEGEQHHAQAVLRAVENCVPLVRCANAGVTALIDATGRSGAPSDFFAMEVTPRGPEWPTTPYTRWGDWLFAWPCVGVVAWLAVQGRARRHRLTSPSAS